MPAHPRRPGPTRALAAMVMLALLLPAASAAIPMGLAPAGPAAGLASPTTPEELVAAWASLQAPGTAPAALAALAGASLAAAPALARPGLRPAEVLDAVAPLLRAQAGAARTLAPWHEPGDHVAAWAGEAAAFLRAVEPAPAAATAREALQVGFALRAVPGPGAALPEVPAFDGFPAAVEALFRHHRAEPPEALRALAATVPAPTGPAMARIVAAYLFAAEATRVAFAADPDAPDLGLLAAMQERVASVVLDAAPGLQPTPDGGFGATCTSGLLGFELPGSDNAWGSDGDAAPCAVVIDLGGDDTYRNNAGGAQLINGLDGPTVALLVDAGGHDRYLGQCNPLAAGNCGVNGGARQGAGFLFDLGGGDDVYRAAIAAGSQRGGINGGALTGAGFLLDEGGDDHYEGALRDGGVNGGGLTQGLGLLVDGGGADRYLATAATGGVNGGARDGHGVLVDGGGDDAYAGTLGRDGGAQGGAAGPGAQGLLVDLGGNDTYVARADQAGTEALAGLNGGGAHLGTGRLADLGGDDAYHASAALGGALNGGAFRGSGLLLDAGPGRDRYQGAAPNGGVNGGSLVGVAVLVDEGGDNVFLAGPVAEGASHGAAGGVSLFPVVPSLPLRLTGGLGLLVAGAGDDDYTGTGVTQGAGDLYSVGVLLDRGGANAYTAGAGSLAQGAGASGGLGLLVDRGTSGTFTLLDGAAGQGAGLQGVGLLLRPEELSVSRYLNGGGALELLARGAGAGLRLDLGTLAAGVLPEPRCTGSAELSETAVDTGTLTGVPPSGVTVRLCAPDPGTAECIVDPLTGRPVRMPPLSGPECEVPKPATPCTVPAACSAAALLGPEADDWLAADRLDATTSGGLTLVRGVVEDAAAGGPPKREFTKARLVAAEADRTCRAACFAFG